MCQRYMSDKISEQFCDNICLIEYDIQVSLHSFLEYTDKNTRKECCKQLGVSDACLVLCTKDEDAVSVRLLHHDFPNDTPCEKHKNAINKCWKPEGIFQVI